MFRELFARALDEMSYLYMGTQKNQPMVAPAVCSLEEFLEREKAREPVKYFENPGYVPKVEISEPVRRKKYNISKFSFESPVYSPFPANNMVHGRFYERHGEPDAPMVMLLHGWRMESYAFFDRFCRVLVSEGFNCAMPDLPYHMNRTPKHSFAGEHTFTDDAIHTLETIRQTLFDVMSVMNWAREKKKSRKVGVMGMSFGAMMSGLLACVEPTLDFAVLVAPPADPRMVFDDSRLGRLIEKENPRAGRLVRRYNETLSNIALTNMRPMIPIDRIFIAEGLYDGMVPVAAVERLWESWGKPEMKRYPHGHLSIILFNPELETDLRKWLRGVNTDSPLGK